MRSLIGRGGRREIEGTVALRSAITDRSVGVLAIGGTLRGDAMCRRILILTAMCLVSSVVSAAPAGQDLKLWYTKPASKWVEALPIGNGRLGAMVFGGT